MRMFDYIQRMLSLKRRMVEIVQSFFRRRSSDATATPPLASPSRHDQHYSYHRRCRLHNRTSLVIIKDSLRELVRVLNTFRLVVRAMRVALNLFSARGLLI